MPGSNLETNTTESLPFLDIEPESKKQFRGYFILGAGYGPDFSTVGMDNFIAPGARWKIDLGYAFSSRFQLQSGVIIVNNKYEAYGDEYHAPDRYWQNGEVPDEVYGECKMIDIPLNLRYNVITSGRHRAFVTSGISTYFLTKEDYNFNYYEDYPYSPDYWGTDKTSVYPFSIVNFSAGYEYMLKGRGSFQIEPFMKIPTGGVGWEMSDTEYPGHLLLLPIPNTGLSTVLI
ncbi:MAG: outer membrane beta-barrel protein [Cyclobacteriaceae bacterium]|nr:outer membrane beta-barrel protein [Cyclobacteriaceae bacterium]